MEWAAISCIAVAVIFTVVLLLVAARETRVRLIASRGRGRSSELILRILRAKYPRRFILCGIRLPEVTVPALASSKPFPERVVFGGAYAEMRRGYSPPPAPPKYCRIDYLVIGRGGITVIAASSMRGYIENPLRGDWRQFYQGEVIKQFRNPFEKCSILQRALSAELRRHGIAGVPMHCLLIFLDPDTRFKNRISGIISTDRLPDALSDINRNKFLTSSEMVRISQILSKK